MAKLDKKKLSMCSRIFQGVSLDGNDLDECPSEVLICTSTGVLRVIPTAHTSKVEPSGFKTPLTTEQRIPSKLTPVKTCSTGNLGDPSTHKSLVY